QKILLKLIVLLHLIKTLRISAFVTKNPQVNLLSNQHYIYENHLNNDVYTNFGANMQLETLSYTSAKGWSKAFPKLDSDKTLILVFGSPHYRNDHGPIEELISHYPKAFITGCSTAGE